MRLIPSRTLLFTSILMATSATAEEKMPNLNESARYAFISDKVAPQLAVFDALEKKALQTIKLRTVADILGISKGGGYVAYAKCGEKKLYLFNLSTQKQTSIATEKPINDFIVHADGEWIAYTSDDGTGLLNLKTGKETAIDTKGEVSLLYHTIDDSLFVAELSRGRLQRIKLTNDLAGLSVKTLIDSNKPMSPISVMPNGIALFFSTGGKLQRYSLLDDELISVAIKTGDNRPYMTSDSRFILALNSSQTDEKTTELLAINSYTYKVKSRYTIKDWQLPDHNKDFVVTGWLEQLAMLSDENSLYRIDLQKPDLPRKIIFPSAGSVRDMLVQSDSKTLLLTRENSRVLSIFDLRTQEMTDIDLALQQPNHIVMGETNTLCH